MKKFYTILCTSLALETLMMMIYSSSTLVRVIGNLAIESRGKRVNSARILHICI